MDGRVCGYCEPLASADDNEFRNVMSYTYITMFGTDYYHGRNSREREDHNVESGGVWRTTTMTLKREGIRGLYKGCIMANLRQLPAAIVTFVTYENNEDHHYPRFSHPTSRYASIINRLTGSATINGKLQRDDWLELRLTRVNFGEATCGQSQDVGNDSRPQSCLQISMNHRSMAWPKRGWFSRLRSTLKIVCTTFGNSDMAHSFFTFGITDSLRSIPCRMMRSLPATAYKTRSSI
ncbi:hypothetical protein KIN20_006274 [Parelaphostrongylus tenuis]|uniref:Uncharacterized protein n=1 Tax=Parelaphostrongylus tenuis TaxID=148309 RepID=A0AAD5M5T6_PARTN|nr:hypothetical protein KIN20_006274 [Parelaphostrongylus tenuis]